MQMANALKKGSIYVVLLLALLFFLVPFLILLFNAFKTNAEIIASPFSLPVSISFKNFGLAMDQMKYWSAFSNSAMITFISLTVILICSAMTAHYFVRNKTRMNTMWFLMMVASMIIPFQSIMIPLVSIYGAELGWIQSQPKLTLMFMYVGFGSSLAVFVYHGFIKSIPLELEEAAQIDGCNSIQTFFKIVLPILMPTAVTIGILHVLWIWNDYLLPVLILQNAGSDNYTLPLAIQVFRGSYSSDYERYLPAVVMVVLPIMVVYLFAQRFIIQGVTQGSVK
ncbi:carbohydrate ABC transporter permease [Paenibacillus sp. FSL W7-1287]|uniref:carbohydrate ABC transporter permease n=1 Tax=Paenibacillus sp. FSL W7-1287 TaxID=2954538 RepID=UPI004046A3A4